MCWMHSIMATRHVHATYSIRENKIAYSRFGLFAWACCRILPTFRRIASYLPRDPCFFLFWVRFLALKIVNSANDGNEKKVVRGFWYHQHGLSFSIFSLPTSLIHSCIHHTPTYIYTHSINNTETAIETPQTVTYRLQTNFSSFDHKETRRTAHINTYTRETA